MRWVAEAPANIALIKYMGKKDSKKNIPDNPSLSYTLNHLRSYVTLETHPGSHDAWEPLNTPGSALFQLSATAQARFLAHLTNVKQYFNYQGSFLVRSSNNFPHSSGLASSASSFAALTHCACNALSELTKQPLPSIEIMAQLSRQGSGSSCRSFFSPWALWDETIVNAIELPQMHLHHEVILISQAEKAVSSSTAHARIHSSPWFAGRSARANLHLTDLLTALKTEDWHRAFTICWHEFQDMHRLFNTCEQPFSYINDNSLSVLKTLQDEWERTGDGPIVTMDAGPNIHLLYQPNQLEWANRFKADHLVGHYDVL